MLRFFVLLLVLMNGVYLAWTQGWLRPYGFAPIEISEPKRLQEQIQPQAMRILSPQELALAQEQAMVVAKPPECLQAGLFDDNQAMRLRRALEAALPAASWQLALAVEPARWIVYVGKFSTPQALDKKRRELEALSVKLEDLKNSALEPGLSLGGFDTQAAAQAELAALSRKGVKTARVVQERPEARGSILKIAAADDALRSKLEEIKPVLAGKNLRLCK
jgi:hypothetical protein